MFVNNGEIILASGSPRRKRFLQELELEFAVQVAEVDETVIAGESPREFVCRLSLEKAKFVALENRDAYVIGADTVVVLDGRILGKPENSSEAVNMLNDLSGRTHEVWTGFTVCNVEADRTVTRAVCTSVTFSNVAKGILSAYVKTGEPLDKAGAYGIQGRGGMLVEKIDGSYSNVVGLPMAELIAELIALGVIKLQT